MKNSKSIAILAGVIAMIAIPLHADVLASYKFNTTNGVYQDPPYTNPPAATGSGAGDAGVHSVAPATQGANVNASAFAIYGDGSGNELQPYYAYNQTYAGFGYGVVNGNDFATTLSDSETDNQYLTLTIAPTAGNTLSLSDIDFSGVTFHSGEGSDHTTDTYYLLSGGIEYGSFSVDSADNQPGGPDNPGSTGDISLGTSFENLTGPVTFDLYLTVGGADIPDGTGPQGLRGGTLNINGTTAPLLTPEPSTYALLALGFAGLILTIRHRRSTV